MAIIRKTLPNGINGNYVKYDPRIFLIKDLSDGAKVLYGYVASMRNGGEFSDVFFMKGLSLSPSAFKRRKKELVDAGLMLVDRVGLKNYILYVGFIGMSATEVKRRWLENDQKDAESLTVNDVINEQEFEAKIENRKKLHDK